MAGVVKLRLGAKVTCSNGPAGTLTRFIIDLDSGHVTHLDVAHHAHGDGHLVPIAVVADAGDEIHLSCSTDEFSDFRADTTTHGDIASARSFYDPEALIQMPMGRMGMFGAYGPSPATVTQQFTPQDSAGVTTHEPAFSSDDHHVGQIDGLVVEPSIGRITHVLLAEGHVFDKKEVAVPSESVALVDEHGARFSVTRDEIEALPAV